MYMSSIGIFTQFALGVVAAPLAFEITTTPLVFEGKLLPLSISVESNVRSP